MPLTGSDSVLAAALKAELLKPGSGAVDNAALTALCNAIASTVIAHVVAHALVMPTALLSTAPGSPVAGTGTIT